MSRLEKLAALAGDMSQPDPAENNPALSIIRERPMEVDGQPTLDEGIKAMLILCNCSAQWAGQYWAVKREGWDSDCVPRGWNTHKQGRYRAQTGVSAHATFEEWRTELQKLTGQVIGA